jgi:hypothetical protein
MSKEDIANGDYEPVNRGESAWKETDFDEFAKDIGADGRGAIDGKTEQPKTTK